MNPSHRAALRHGFLRLWHTLRQMARLIVGIPDYDTYVAHLRRHHPDRTPLSYEAFFAERQVARYGKGRSRCC
ncbi:YbdD/YjiX family protein [Tahibacter amnicola]|uniref:YbdD/YjiX family protein n=1 Tax=Tahibacter amnicola TaxID=2976241 RepID=A0ABY6BC44_9GAMM|nr:YbdD/YjiX family protein [Tahibacter amnicola]UXI67141.1 YbdD/YjiX family protein [Tahibacter amnicola]